MTKTLLILFCAFPTILWAIGWQYHLDESDPSSEKLAGLTVKVEKKLSIVVDGYFPYPDWNLSTEEHGEVKLPKSSKNKFSLPIEIKEGQKLLRLRAHHNNGTYVWDYLSINFTESDKNVWTVKLLLEKRVRKTFPKMWFKVRPYPTLHFKGELQALPDSFKLDGKPIGVNLEGQGTFTFTKKPKGKVTSFEFSGKTKEGQLEKKNYSLNFQYRYEKQHKRFKDGRLPK